MNSNLRVADDEKGTLLIFGASVHAGGPFSLESADMQTHAILNAIDAEITRLQQAKVLLSGLSTKPQRAVKKRHLSAEARAKIAAAQRARWAKTKKAAK